MQEKKNRADWKLPFLVIVMAGIILLVLLVFGGDPGFSSKKTGHSPAAAGVEKSPTSVLINASPQKYSPLMSSTPGIGLVPVPSGFGIADARYEWNASYGQFLDWSAPGYHISQKGESAESNGEKIYWSFSSFPPAPQDPAIISLTAKDRKTGAVLGGSRMTLGWEQNYTFVVVQKIE